MTFEIHIVGKTAAKDSESKILKVHKFHEFNGTLQQKYYFVIGGFNELQFL